MSSDLRKKAEASYEKAKSKADDTLRTVKAKAGDATQKTAEGLEHSPLIAVIGGLALGAIAAALLPKSGREDEILGKTGDRIRTTATNAAKAARETAKEQLDTLGVSTGAAKDQLRGLVDKISKAANSATEAAAEAIRKK
jgi:hypothetical protein